MVEISSLHLPPGKDIVAKHGVAGGDDCCKKCRSLRTTFVAKGKVGFCSAGNRTQSSCLWGMITAETPDRSQSGHIMLPAGFF